jgi:DNA-binding NtrC family response regulator
MKILIVDDDDDLVAFLAKELEARGFEILQTHFGDGGLKLYNRYGPFEFVLSDYRFIPGTQIKDGVQLVAAIHGINPHQQMALMTAAPERARSNLPQALRHLTVLRKRFRRSKCCDCCGRPCCRCDLDWNLIGGRLSQG